MSEPEQPAGPRPIPHFWLYAIAVVLLVLSAISATISFAVPTLHQMPGLAGMFGTVAALMIGAVTVVRRNDYVCQLRWQEAQAQRRQIDEVAAARKEQIDELAAATGRQFDEIVRNQAVLAYEMRRIVAYAERTLGASHDISEAIEVVRKHVDELPPAGDADQLKAISARLDELSRDFAQSQVARLHRPGRQRGESDYS